MSQGIPPGKPLAASMASSTGPQTFSDKSSTSGPQALLQSRSPSQNPITSSSGLRLPSNKRTIYDRNLSRSRNAELNRSTFAFLFMEMVSYAQNKVKGIQELEKRLSEQGHPLGMKLLDLILYRSTPAGSLSSSSSIQASRPLRILPLLTLLTTRLYPVLFSRPADSLEQSTTNPGEYMIIDNTPLTNQYISVPKDMSQLSCAAFVAGIIEGVCHGAGFDCKVSAHNHGTDMWPARTVFLVKFEEAVLEREKELERAGVK